jgi:hypothetical protein
MTFTIILNAKTLNFALTLSENNFSKININKTNNSIIKNNISTKNNFNDINKTFININVAKSNQTNLTQITQIQTIEEDFNDTIISINSKVELAVVINKQKFFKLIPSLMNALNAYFSQKGIEYNIELYNSDVNLSKIKYEDILYFAFNDNLSNLCEYNKTFYLPLINKNETNISCPNIYFGSINFKKQITSLSQFIDDKTNIITDDTIISQKLFNYEKNLTFLSNIYHFSNVNYKKLSNSFVIFNTDAGKSAQILSKITQKNIQTKLILIPQLGYDPLMIILTQPADVKKLLIANSIIHPPVVINEYARILNSDIQYNWINYSSCILANKIYNKQNNEDKFYMNDFNIYIFDNQIDYKVKLFKIINGAFKKVD